MDIKQVKKYKLLASPGCYLFFNAVGEIIYIGKAVNLKSRVLSYWQKSSQLNPMKEQMVLEIAKIKWIWVESEVEAFLLEANLIKKHHPKYNVLLRDDKRFSYIKVSTEEEWPRVYSARTIDKAGRYFGPFTSGESVRQTLKLIRRIWPYRSCSRLPKRACLYYHVGKCQGACEEKITRKEYLEYIRQVIRFLEGRKKDIVRDLKKEIRAAGKKLKEELPDEQRLAWEKKLELFNFRLLNIERVLEMSKVITVGEKYLNDVVELAKLLRLPKVPDRIEGYDVSNTFGLEAVGSMVVFSGGEAERSQYRKFRIKAQELDFSFLKARGGDIKMLEEILERRFRRYAAAKAGSENKKPASPRDAEKSWPLPDLIIIDGGKAQLNVASRVLKKYKLDIPVIAISKGDGLRSAKAPDKLFFAGEKTALELPLASPALHLIKRVRDEAHRFAISYHKLLRKKKLFGR
ncbi:MAG: excinuclease ABC subunit UvrC [Patescibacteria group bacterium]|jgi:excinuclease ABC subunit C